MGNRWNKIAQHSIYRKVPIFPLVTFRILFGLLLSYSTIRFWAKGWIYSQYIEPKFFFPFIEGLQPLPGMGMYVVFSLMILASIFIVLGLYYRVSTISFFLLFTYVELLDKTNYLNHYYFVSLCTFLMIWLPANRYFSVDVWRRMVTPVKEVQVFFINIIKLQLGIVYFFAGIAKINYDWLINAQPLKLWLSAQVHQPMIGWIFRFKITAYIFSWFGMIFDTTVPFLLSFQKTLPFAYAAVIGFHLMTALLFPIGVFPWMMIVATTIFFPNHIHQRIIERLSLFFSGSPDLKPVIHRGLRKASVSAFILLFILQIAIPFRYLAYPGNLFWNELGYRFSWRVMLMEKAGHISFFVEDGERKHMVANYDYLTPQQEKMMATQPDMIMQFARFLEKEFKEKGFENPRITTQSRVTLNGRSGKPFIDPNIDLTKVHHHQLSSIVLPYE
ncbi:MAG: HTTM domain-containing protein [Cyclobacteriaceae bacterium]